MSPFRDRDDRGARTTRRLIVVIFGLLGMICGALLVRSEWLSPLVR